MKEEPYRNLSFCIIANALNKDVLKSIRLHQRLSTGQAITGRFYGRFYRRLILPCPHTGRGEDCDSDCLSDANNTRRLVRIQMALLQASVQHACTAHAFRPIRIPTCRYTERSAGTRMEPADLRLARFAPESFGTHSLPSRNHWESRAPSGRRLGCSGTWPAVPICKARRRSIPTSGGHAPTLLIPRLSTVHACNGAERPSPNWTCGTPRAVGLGRMALQVGVPSCLSLTKTRRAYRQRIQ